MQQPAGSSSSCCLVCTALRRLAADSCAAFYLLLQVVGVAVAEQLAVEEEGVLAPAAQPTQGQPPQQQGTQQAAGAAAAEGEPKAKVQQAEQAQQGGEEAMVVDGASQSWVLKVRRWQGAGWSVCRRGVIYGVLFLSVGKWHDVKTSLILVRSSILPSSARLVVCQWQLRLSKWPQPLFLCFFLPLPAGQVCDNGCRRGAQAAAGGGGAA